MRPSSSTVGPRFLASRPAVGEVVGSVSMLAITIALLGGASYLALSSINGATSMVDGSSQQEAQRAGLLIDAIASQSNATGTYVWLLDYGWVNSPVSAVLVDDRPVSWSSNCQQDWSGSLCVLTLPPEETGLATVVIGGKSLEVSL